MSISQPLNEVHCLIHLIIVISALKTERGLALPDLLGGAFEFIDTLKLEPHARVYLLDHFATLEFVIDFDISLPSNLEPFRHRLAAGASEKIQLTALLGSFKNAVEMSVKA